MVSQHALQQVPGVGVGYPSIPCRSPGPHQGGFPRPTPGGSPGPHWGGGIPACTVGGTHPTGMHSCCQTKCTYYVHYVY